MLMSLEKDGPMTNSKEIEGVHIWNAPTFVDRRGKLFKAYVEGPVPSFPEVFVTFEHFFTESKKNVFRGLHFQGAPHSASKVVTIVKGRAIDFLLDVRKTSKTYGFIQIQPLNGEEPHSIYIPEGVAHGYISLEAGTIISYRQDKAFCGNCDGGVSGDILEEYLPLKFEETIRSERDSSLQQFSNFIYQSKCTG